MAFIFIPILALQLLSIVLDFKSITLLVQIVTGALLTKLIPLSATGKAIDDDLVHFDAVAAESQVFPMVQNEGLVALSLICAMNPASSSKIAQYESSLIPAMTNILTHGTDIVSPFAPPKVTVDKQSASPQIGSTVEHTYSIQMKTNVCLLFNFLLTNDGKSSFCIHIYISIIQLAKFLFLITNF